MKKVEYLIIGNSAGGIAAAEAIRQVDKSGEIAIISDEPCAAYCRARIAEHLAYGRSVDDLLFRPADFYEKNGIQAILGRRAEWIDAGAHRVQIDDGTGISWGKLLLATGGRPIVPEMEGVNRKGVFTFTTFDDARAIALYIEKAERAVVIGGGLIGTSAIEALVKRGLKVTVVEMKERILNTILDEEASALEAEAMKQAGVDIITGATIFGINGPSTGAEVVSSVTLDSGREIPCQLVVVAIGVTPRLELAAAAGIKVNRGIAVDRRMATSCPDVYACGDVAEAHDFVYQGPRLTPVWPNAYLGGRVAGFNMAGVAADYPGGTAINSMKYFGVDITSAGITVPPDDSYRVLRRRQNGSYRRVVVKVGCVVGMVFAGDIEKSGIVFKLMKERVDVSQFVETLVADDFGLICLPEDLWRSQLVAPDKVLK